MEICGWEYKNTVINTWLVESTDEKPIDTKSPTVFIEKKSPIIVPEHLKSLLFKGQVQMTEPRWILYVDFKILVSRCGDLFVL